MRILIVGLGAIGAGSGVSAGYESHLSVTTGLGFEIVGGVDVNPKRQSEFYRSTGKPAFEDLSEAFTTNPDVIAIASNPENHLRNLISAIKYFPESAVVCEKPFGSNGTESKEMLELIINSEVESFVNYTRQFSKGFLTLKNTIQGNLVTGSVKYNHGLVRSCSHYIRLCLGLFGPFKELRYIYKPVISNNPSFQMLFENSSTINFIGVPDSNIRIADFSLTTNRETISITDAMNWKLLESNHENLPKWHRELEVYATGDFSGGLKELYYNILNKNEMTQLSTSVLDALPNLIIDQILAHV